MYQDKRYLNGFKWCRDVFCSLKWGKYDESVCAMTIRSKKDLSATNACMFFTFEVLFTFSFRRCLVLEVVDFYENVQLKRLSRGSDFALLEISQASILKKTKDNPAIIKIKKNLQRG